VLNRLNKFLEKCMPVMTPLSVLTGLLLSSYFSPYTGLVPWIFAFITFAGSMSLNFKDLGKVVLYPYPILAFLAITHVGMPLLAWGAGHLAFPGDAYTITGLILLLSIPTGIVSFMWVSIYRGHIALTLTMILIDTMLAPFLVPYTLSLLVGAKVQMDVWGMMEGLIWMVVAPSVVGMLLNQWTRGRIKSSWGPKMAPFSKLGLAVVIMINSSALRSYFNELSPGLLYMALICLVIVAIGYIVGRLSASLFGWSRDVAVTMTFNCGMKNLSAGAVLAIAYFPPPVALPAIIGMLFQQLLASVFANALFREKAVPEAAAGKQAQL
jgi:BASS family bile acid:Na+ symporter